VAIDIRDNIKNYVEYRGFMKQAIAQKANMTSSQFSSVLHKRRELNADEFFAICIAMEITPEQLKAFRPPNSKFKLAQTFGRG